MPYIGTARESIEFFGRPDFGNDLDQEFTQQKLIANGKGPYLLDHAPVSGPRNSESREEQIYVWIGGVFQSAENYYVSEKQLVFHDEPSVNQTILIKFKTKKLKEGLVADRSAGDSAFAAGSITPSKFKNNGQTGYIGWDLDGKAAIVPNPDFNRVNRFNIAMNEFKILRNNGLGRQGMVDGIADEFNDESGIDTVTSTNETWNALGYYTNGVGSDMTLVSEVFNAIDPDPATAYVVMSHDYIGAGSMNTDTIVEVTRNGSNWTTVNMTLGANNTESAGIDLFTGFVDLTNQPAGTAMQYRVRTLNTIEQRVHAVSLQWRF